MFMEVWSILSFGKFGVLNEIEIVWWAHFEKQNNFNSKPNKYFIIHSINNNEFTLITLIV